jgi:DNA adenine methylase
MKLRGEKRRKHYDEFLKEFLPEHIEVYVEPFGGTFNMSTYLKNRPTTLVYNDIHDYGFDIDCDIELHKDYKEVIEEYDSQHTVFYLDPPYYGKEDVYGLMKNDEEFHVELKDQITNLTGKVIISYEDVPFIRKLYKDYQIETYKGDTYYLLNEILIIIS